jgi:hypothetical protein
VPSPRPSGRTACSGDPHVAVAHGVHAVRGLIRRFRPGPPTPERRPTSSDAFAAFRDPTGPILVAGPTPRHDPSLDDRPSVVVLVPHLQLERMSGGPNTIFHVTMPLAAAGRAIRYVATGGPRDADVEALRRHVANVSGVSADAVEFVDASRPDATLDLGAGDVLMATWWPTAHTAAAALDVIRARAFVYLIQDFEPGFYPWSTKYALAAATYDLPFHAIVNEPTLLDHLRASGVGRFADGSQSAISFMPAVDPVIFARRRRKAGGPRRLVFYARPKHARNLFDLGLAVLRAAEAEGVFRDGDWELSAIGETIPELQVGDRVLRPMPWLDYAAYGAFLAEADVLLSLMLSPHTSYPPLEMVGTGGRVVTNTFGGKTRAALEAISPRIHAAPPAVAPLVAALAEAVAATNDRQSDDVTPGLPTSWDEALRDVTPWLAATVEALRADS